MNADDTQKLHQAVSLAQANRIKEAYAELKQLLQTNPDNTDILLWLVFTANNLAESRFYLDKVVSLKPDHFALENARNWLITEEAKHLSQAVPVSQVAPNQSVKTEERPKQTQNQAQAVFAMVALQDKVLPEASKIFKFLTKAFPEAPNVSNVEQRDGTITFQLGAGNGAGTIALIPAPIPWSDLANPCASAVWYWPEATSIMKRHVAHIIVATLGGSSDMIKRHILVSQLIAAVTATTKSAGVYWGNGSLVNSAQDFIEQSRGMTPTHLPLNLWINFEIQRVSATGVQLATTGLSAFNQMEIEIAPSTLHPSQLIDIAYGMATYILTSGAVIKDGDTIGRSATEQIRIRYTSSLRDTSVRVMRLEW